MNKIRYTPIESLCLPRFKAVLLFSLWVGFGGLFASSARGEDTNETYLAQYAPYLNGKPWPRVAVIAYIEGASNVWRHPTDPQHFPAIQEIREPDADFTTVVIRFPEGDTFKTYNKPILGPYLSAVYSGDFNNDGVPDFMMIKPGSGCGIAGEYCTGVFAFSDAHDFRFSRVTTMGLGPHDLVLDPKTKEFRLIHTSLCGGECLDGRSHNFWVHRFYKWDFDRFEKDETLQSIWVQYLG